MKIPLKKMREDRGITQAEFSQIMNVAPSTIGMWEQNRREPSCENLNRIADYYGVTVDYLLGREERRLGNDETSLLEKYRKLTDAGKAALLNIIEQMQPA